MELSPDAAAAVDKIQKLLNLAAKAGTPEEAASAAAKAQELLAKHNLSAEVLERADVGSGKRQREAVDGGFYAFQRDLWRSVARLNFCAYWTQKYRTEAKRTLPDGTRLLLPRVKRRHALVGRVVNVRATVAMATYLTSAIERLTREALPDEEARLGRWAISFREGAVETVSRKLYDRRRELEREEEKALEAARRAHDDAVTGKHSTSRALSLSSFAKSEEDANYDFIVGEDGAAARLRAERAAARARDAEEAAAEERRYAEWAEANPEEARKAEAEARKAAADARKREERNARRRTGPRPSYGSDTRDWGAYRAGREAGEKVGLDPQASAAKRAGIGR